MILNPKTKAGIKIKIAFLESQLQKAHETGNEEDVIKLEKEIEILKKPIKKIEQKVPDVSNDIKKRMEWII